MTKRGAVDFVVAQIIDEASRCGIDLSDTEREVLCFSEGPRTPHRMIEVMEAFERDCDEGQYERKIAGLLRSAHERTRSNQKGDWQAAIERIRDTDVYVGVMMDQAGLLRPPGDWWRVLAAGASILVLIVGLGVFIEPTLNRHLSSEEQGLYLWLSLVAAGCLYTIARWIFGAAAVDRFTASIIDTVTFRRKPRDPSESSTR